MNLQQNNSLFPEQQRLKESLLSILFFITFSLLLSNDGEAGTPVVLSTGLNKYPLGLHVDILEDPTRKLGIADVLKMEFADRFCDSGEYEFDTDTEGRRIHAYLKDCE